MFAVTRRALVLAAVVAAGLLGAAWPLAVARWQNDTRARDRRLGAFVVTGATRLGPCFVKIAQMFSYRADLLSADFLAPLAALQEDVRYQCRRGDAAMCLRELERLAPEIEVDPVPAAAGSVALVFKGRLLDGGAVAVKVVRPWVAVAIATDNALLRIVIRLLTRLPAFRDVPLVAMFDEVAAMVERQADMVAEGRTLDRFAAHAHKVAGVEMPRRTPGIAPDPYVLVMEWVGERRPLCSAGLSDSDFRQASRSLLRRLYQMIFVEGLVHCDLHPGNVLSDGGVRLTLVDVGLVAQLRDEDRVAFRDFFAAFVSNDVARCADAIVRSAVQRPRAIDSRGLHADVSGLLAAHHGRRVGDFSIVGFVRAVFELQRRHRLYGAPGFVTAIWALAMYEGLVRDRYPDLDFQAEARPYVVSHWIAAARVR